MKKKLIGGIVLLLASLLFIGCDGLDGKQDIDTNYDVRTTTNQIVLLDLRTGSFYPKTAENSTSAGGGQTSQYDKKYTIKEYPKNGEIYLINSILEYRPKSGYEGADKVILEAEDEWERVKATVNYSVINNGNTDSAEGELSIQGSPRTSVGQDEDYIFTPIVSNPRGDVLTYTIRNKPSWATFSSTTGQLSGTTPQSELTTTGIQIKVYDEVSSASLAPFTISVK